MPLIKLNHRDRSRLTAVVILIVTTAVVASIVWAFAQQIALAREMRAEEVRLEQAVASERAHHDGLATQLAYVQSDEYVEHWARAEACMVRMGEVAVVLSADLRGQPAGDPIATPPQPPAAQSFWLELWGLFFGPVE